MDKVLNDFAAFINSLLDPLELAVSAHINYSFMAIALLCVSSVAFYRSVTDKYTIRFNMEEILRNFFHLIIVVLFASGKMKLLTVVLVVYLFINIFMDIKETARRRFTRRIE